MFKQKHILSYTSANITRSLAADEVLITVNVPFTIYTRVLTLWLLQIGTNGLNEPNAMEIVRCSANGVGGIVAQEGEWESGNTPKGLGIAVHIDADGWTTAPPVTDVLGGARPFNLNSGWRWNSSVSKALIISPNTNVHFYGFRIVDAISAAMTFQVGITVAYIG